MDMRTGDIHSHPDLPDDQLKERMADGSRRFVPIPQQMLGKVIRASKADRIAMMRELQASKTLRNRAKRERKRGRS